MRSAVSILLIISCVALVQCESLTGEETTEYSFSASASPSEAGSVSPESGTYEEGSEVEVTASANEGWNFTEWTGDVESTENPVSVTIDSDTEITANFAEVTYELTASASPSEGGSVDPESATYSAGDEVEVEATASEGWEFVEWTGDQQSTDNPLTFNISSDTDLTANFEQLPQAFSSTVTVSDGTNSIDLTLGMESNATSGYDSGLDQEVPPPPPSGSFYGQFNIPNYNLKTDYRAVSDEEVVWEMEFAPQEGNSLTLEWDFSSIDHVGSLMLVDDTENPSLELDMKSNTSHSVSSSTNVLYIISN